MLKVARTLPALLGFAILCVLSCTTGKAQQADVPRTNKDGSPQRAKRIQEGSELTKGNLDRVAASAGQIREILLKDAGLLVELKRWVAKDAGDHGQVVEDSSLTDEAIFDRLEHDIEFRSRATVLLQRYGYLTPTLNPESDLGKQQLLLLQARARQMAQIEAQEEMASMQAEQANRAKEALAECDVQEDESCNEQPQATGRLKNKAAAPQRSPDTTTPEIPFAPDQQPAANPQILRASGGAMPPGFADGLSKSALGAGSAANAGLGGINGAGSTSTLTPAALDSILSGRSNIPPDLLAAGLARNNANDQPPAKETFENGTRPPSAGEIADIPSVRIVHRPNPYADVPSLYDMYVQAAVRQRPLERFGLEVFRNNSNQPDVIPMDLPVGPDYVVGPGDGLAIDLWGGMSQRMVRTVDREGRVSLPESGPLLVSGRTLGEVQLAVQQALRTQFRDISADVSLSRLRTVRVYVVGEVSNPGAYDVSSLSTPLNALFAAGGVTPKGSLRSLKHYRGKQLVEEVDAYDLLLHGVNGDLQRLENGDTLLVPPIGPQVTVDGMVRRPAIYETHGEKSLAEILELAGGILPAATLRHVEVQRIEAHEKRTMISLDLSAKNDTNSDKERLSAVSIHDGDEVHIFPIAPYNQDAIYLQGHVLRPGRYSYKSGMKLTDLIGSYSDLLPEPAPHYAEIIRLKAPDFRPTVESFDLSSALANPASSPTLQPLDTVRVFSRFDFEPAPSVWVGGEVRAPGQYSTSGQVHLRDAVFLASGVTPDASLDSAQIFRTQPNGTMKIFSVNLRDALSGNPTDNILLQPRDRLLIHKNSAQVDPPTVYIKGEVARPGRYPLTESMQVEDLVRAAGGLKRSAYTETADLTRFAASDPEKGSEQLTVNLEATNNGDPKGNLTLRDGDVLAIRQVPGWNDLGASVTVRGEVRHPGTYGVRPGERLSSVLQRAGGYSPEAYPYAAVLTRRDVKVQEDKDHEELVRRVQVEQTNMKFLPENDLEQKAAKYNALAQSHATLEQLRANPPVGRMVIHIQDPIEKWRNTSADIAVRDGDVLVVPKKTGYIMVNGQVFNPTAVGYHAGRSANWYLSQAGGLTQLADRKATFVVRADGSVISAKNNSGWFTGDPLNSVLRPGDTVIVPEKALNVGSRNWTAILQFAQIASSAAVTAAYLAAQ
ncbi:MAG TPA: SLBB domain-containing protein [Candidatus Acidoferrum sp.]|jgi:protein involved in polysaccharide export with SLBB domain